MRERDGGGREGGNGDGGGAGVDTGDAAGGVNAGDGDAVGAEVAAAAAPWGRRRGLPLPVQQVMDADAGDDLPAVPEPVRGDAGEAGAGEPAGVPGGGGSPDAAQPAGRVAPHHRVPQRQRPLRRIPQSQRRYRVSGPRPTRRLCLPRMVCSAHLRLFSLAPPSIFSLFTFQSTVACPFLCLLVTLLRE